MATQKKMVPWVKVPIAHLQDVLGVQELAKAKQASIYGAFVKFDLEDEETPDGLTGIVAGKTPWILVAISDIEAAVQKVVQELGAGKYGQISFDLVGGFVVFTGHEVDFK